MNSTEPFNARLQQVVAHFEDSAKLKLSIARDMAPAINAAAESCVRSLRQGGKILVCGNGGSAADSQHFAAELVGRFEKERAALPAIALTTDTSALTAIGNDYAFDQVFSRQVAALGRKGDVLIGITTSGNSGNVMKAVEAAHTQSMAVIALTGRDGGKLVKALKEGDVSINVPNPRTARIQEVHILSLHCIADLIDSTLSGE